MAASTRHPGPAAAANDTAENVSVQDKDLNRNAEFHTFSRAGALPKVCKPLEETGFIPKKYPCSDPVRTLNVGDERQYIIVFLSSCLTAADPGK